MKAQFEACSAANDDQLAESPSAQGLAARIQHDIPVSWFAVPPLPAPRFARVHLLQRLGAPADWRLVALSAPAGYGKTSLVREWQDQMAVNQPTRYAWRWLRIDGLNAEPAILLRVLSAAFADALPTEILPPATLDHSEVPLQNARLMNAIAQDSRHWVLVLDQIPTNLSATFIAFFNDWIGSIPANITLVLASRGRLPLRLSSLRLNRQCLELQGSDLRLRSDEEEQWSSDVSPSQVLDVGRAADGWPLAWSFLRVIRKDGNGVLPRLTAQLPLLRDYFAEEVLSQFSSSELRQLSILARFSCVSDRLCEAIFSFEQPLAAQQWGAPLFSLNQWQAKGVFLEAQDERSEWYRLHPLFCDAVMQAYPLDESVLKDLWRRASRWFLDQGMLTEAFDAARQAGDSEALVHIVRERSERILLSQDIAALLRWHPNLPQSAFTQDARLAILYAWAFAVSGQLGQAERLIDGIDGADGQVEAQAGADVKAQLSAVRAFICRARGELEPAERHVQDALYGLSPERVGGRVMVLATAANLRCARRQYREASDFNRLAVRLARESGDIRLEMLTLYDRARIELASGYLHQAKALLEQALQLGETHQVPAQSVVRSRLQIYRSLVYWYQHRLDAAQDLARQAIASAESSRDVSLLIGYLVLALVAHSRRQSDSALERIDEIERILQVWSVDEAVYRVLILCARLTIWIDQDRMDLAGHAMQALREVQAQEAYPEIFPLASGLILLLEVKFLIRQRNHVLAFERLAILQREHSTLAPSNMANIYQLVLQAHLNVETQKPDKALSLLRRAMQCAEAEECISPFVELAEPLQSTYRNLAAAGNLNAFMERVLRAVLNIEDDGADADELTDAISSREMGVLELIAQGLSNQEIADQLYISLHTVKTHARRINSKLKVKSRTQAIMRARELGLL